MGLGSSSPPWLSPSSGAGAAATSRGPPRSPWGTEVQPAPRWGWDHAGTGDPSDGWSWMVLEAGGALGWTSLKTMESQSSGGWQGPRQGRPEWVHLGQIRAAVEGLQAGRSSPGSASLLPLSSWRAGQPAQCQASTRLGAQGTRWVARWRGMCRSGERGALPSTGLDGAEALPPV